MAETFDFAVEALAMNYRLNAELVTTLGLLDDCGLLDVVKAVVDLPTLIGAEREKKKGSSGTARERVSIPVGLSTDVAAGTAERVCAQHGPTCTGCYVRVSEIECRKRSISS
jgi:hypothetical protein